MTWIITVLSIIGVLLNIYKNKYCFVIWSGTNFAWMVIDYNAKLYSQSALFMIYFILAIFGLWKWINETKTTE
jgi:membrane protein implicated in regulation of membrane protease activity